MLSRKTKVKKAKTVKNKFNFTWHDNVFLSIKNKYKEIYEVHIYKIEGEEDKDWIFDIVGPNGGVDSGSAKTIKSAQDKSLKILGSFLNLKNMKNR
ncbi:MAG: hypothetical protein ACXW1A_05420 [Nitrososphaeraceae archaeon]